MSGGSRIRPAAVAAMDEPSSPSQGLGSRSCAVTDLTLILLADLLRILAATYALVMFGASVAAASVSRTILPGAVIALGTILIVVDAARRVHRVRHAGSWAHRVQVWPVSAWVGSGAVIIGLLGHLAGIGAFGSRGVLVAVPLGCLVAAEVIAGRAYRRRMLARVVGGVMPLAFLAMTVGMFAIVGPAPVTGEEVADDPAGPMRVTRDALWFLGGVMVGVALIAAVLRRLALWAIDLVRHQWEATRRTDGRRRAEWIHDHLLSEVSHAIHMLRARPEVDHEAVRHLQAVDHRLRIVQLDELIAVGHTRVASIVQPHLRRAESLGLRVDRMPAPEQIDARVDPATGRLLSHVLSVLLSNAANAGAASVGLEVAVRPDEVEVALRDDAGGFDIAAVPPGRALEELRADLGRERIRREEAENGSVVTVRVPRHLLVGHRAAFGDSVERKAG